MDLWVLMLLAMAAVAFALLWRKEVKARLEIDRQTQWRNQELERVLNELHSEKTILEAALCSAEDLLLVADRGMQMCYANPAATRIFGPLPQNATIISYTRSLDTEMLASEALEADVQGGIERIGQLNNGPYFMRAIAYSDWVSIALRDVTEDHPVGRDG